MIGGWDGVLAKEFVRDLNGLTAPTIHLRINSPGGDVFEGRAIATAIRQHSSRVVAHIDGLAASAASYIALAADEVEVAPGAMVMIHRAWGIAMGNAGDMLEMAAVLEKIDDQLVGDYVRETGNSEEKIREWLNAETWFDAEEAVEHGFADRIAEDAPKVDDAWDVESLALISETAPTEPAQPEADPADLAHAERVRRFALIESAA